MNLLPRRLVSVLFVLTFLARANLAPAQETPAGTPSTVAEGAGVRSAVVHRRFGRAAAAAPADKESERRRFAETTEPARTLSHVPV